jgi:hypothetical protein
MTRWLAAALVAALAACGDEAPPTLAKLCEQHPTDKCPTAHNYVETYEQLFAPLRTSTRRILEIGVQHGFSMRMWEAYFPSAKVVGLDIQPRPKVDSSRVTTVVADQGKREDLQAVLAKFGGDYDIIIDDGGHRMDQQQVSLATLFPALRPGGLYIIEDMHTSFPQFYPDFGVAADGSNSTYAMVERLIRTGEVTSPYMTDGERSYLKANIARCSYVFQNSERRSGVLICRKRE